MNASLLFNCSTTQRDCLTVFILLYFLSRTLNLETIMLEVFGVCTVGILIVFCANNNNKWKA